MSDVVFAIGAPGVGGPWSLETYNAIFALLGQEAAENYRDASTYQRILNGKGRSGNPYHARVVRGGTQRWRIRARNAEGRSFYLNKQGKETAREDAPVILIGEEQVIQAADRWADAWEAQTGGHIARVVYEQAL